jgi:hypothetical protein
LLDVFVKRLCLSLGREDNSGCGIPAGHPPIISINLLLVTRLVKDEDGRIVKWAEGFIPHPSSYCSRVRR